ncbi:nicotinamide-nucleotide amidase [Pseudarthrobacter defluvii]|uniref:CinA family protein n=1 Tax=Pseudarthrobacter defluvii TaxID=410837 RepID=UPI002780860F|nr:nicotinamide-nucleotide amidohydrolase family protein [Pseudarthrobacter defluvii]MDQ0769814.1 nicotinamide-nucleotide amidase [Pseudarthrobacter defluvii]
MSNLHLLAGQAVRQAIETKRTVATAESLTAGIVSAVLADTPGASGMLQGGVVAYQNSVKETVLHVPADLLARVGSVDPDVACAMAAGARTELGADVGLSTTGVAGPDAHDGKPVGRVYIGISTAAGTSAFEYSFTGSRPDIRAAACAAALERLLEALAA